MTTHFIKIKDNHWAWSYVPEGGVLDYVDVHFIGPDGLPNHTTLKPKVSSVLACPECGDDSGTCPGTVRPVIGCTWWAPNPEGNL